MTATAIAKDIGHLPLAKQAEHLETYQWLTSLDPWLFKALQHFLALWQLNLIPRDDIPAATGVFIQLCDQYRPADPRAARVQ